MNKAPTVGIVVAVVVIGILVALFVGNKAAEAPSKSAETNQADNSDTAAQSLIITYTDGGFEQLSNSRVAVAATVLVKNNSSRDLDFASDDHPEHQDNPEFNIGNITSGQEKSFIVNTKGEWGFHNHDFSGHSGTITVE
ncbi:MAG: hypothetical protein M3Q36_03210 [bacterium]|nr:hypothetical protein [bacterium]